MQAAWLWCISEPAVSTQRHSTVPEPVSGASTAHAEDVSQSHGADAPSKHELQLDPARQQELRSMVVQELLHACKTKGPPHSISQQGDPKHLLSPPAKKVTLLSLLTIFEDANVKSS